jgi:amino acid permease
MFPMSIPRNISALRFSSLFGVLCTLYLTLTVMFLFFFNRDLVPSMSDNLKNAKAFNFSYSGIVSTTPIIIFAYMYQVNIPSIYSELETRNYK